MKWALVAPGSLAGEPGSGGDRYDAELRRALVRAGHEVTAEPTQDTAATLIDGLLYRTWRPVGRARNVGLIHVPASFLDDDPSLPALEQAFFDRLDAVQFVSALTQRDTAARFRLPAVQWVAEPGCSLVSVERTAATELLLLGIGHVLPNKQVQEAVVLFDGLMDLPGWRAEWLGSTTLSPDCVRTLGTPRSVTLRGQVPHAEVAQTLARASALVSTSRYESWGLAAAEALVAGVPVFSTHPSGLREFLGGAGHRDATTANLRRFVQDQAWRLELGAEALAAAQRLPSWDRCSALTARSLEAL